MRALTSKAWHEAGLSICRLMIWLRLRGSLLPGNGCFVPMSIEVADSDRPLKQANKGSQRKPARDSCPEVTVTPPCRGKQSDKGALAGHGRKHIVGVKE